MEGDPLFVSATITCLGRRKMLCPSCYCQNSSIALPLKMSSMIPQDEQSAVGDTSGTTPSR